MSSKFLYGKGRPRISKKKNKMVSRAKRHGNAHIRGYHLDAMMCPIVSITKRDYGVDEVHNDDQVNAYELPVQGNLSSIHGQTGRQVYMEFLGMPLVEYTTRGVGRYRNTWSFMELLAMAFRRNNWLNSQAYNGLRNMEPDDGTLFGTAANPTGLTYLGNVIVNAPSDTLSLGGSKIVWNTNLTESFTFARDSTNDSLIDFNWCYMGGYQEHIFTNSTNAPIHLEFREYSPRMPMGFDLYRRPVRTPLGRVYNFNLGNADTRNISSGDLVVITSPGNTNWTLGGGSANPQQGQYFVATGSITSGTGTYQLYQTANIDCKKYPLMFMTMYQDLLRGLKSHDDGALIGAHMNSDLNNPGLFDEIDDKGFKYRKGVMVDTDYRFKVSEKKVKTLYPGEKYSYKMIFPPFTGNSLQLFQTVQRSASFIGGTGNAWYGTFGTSPAVMPLFTKGLQVRAIGSTAYLKPIGHNDYATKSYYAYDTNNDAPGTGLTGYQDPAFNQDRPIKHHATHAVRLTHEVKEHHSIKCLPNYKSYHAFNTNFLANAATATDILPTDQMEIVDVVENDLEPVIGDAGNAQ